MNKVNAKAYFKSDNESGITGVVYFDEVHGGTMVTAHIRGLPKFKRNGKPVGPHGFHIHVNGDCTPGTTDNPYPNTGGHYNPTNQPHGNHAGDFPVLFAVSGDTKMRFFTDKFYPKDVIGRSVVIHESPDDYRTEPAGDSGKKLACAVIEEQ
jgi:Cu-Zn family superoxide dismutase